MDVRYNVIQWVHRSTRGWSYGYSVMDPRTGEILQATIASGLLYVADGDARDPGSAHPQGNLWDNGADAIIELEHLLRVRAYALNNFSVHNIRPGRPLATIEEVLVPIYLLHRFQIQAVAKLIGGQYYSYTMRSDGRAAPVTVDAKKQKAAIDALINALDSKVLMLPQSLVDLIPPRPPGHGLGREFFARSTGVNFDPLAPPASLVSLTLDVMLNRQRAARMNAFHAVDSTQPGFAAVLKALSDASWYAQHQTGMPGAIQRLVDEQVLHALMALAADPAATYQVRSQALVSTQDLSQWLEKQNKKRLDSDWSAFYAKARLDIKLWLENPSKPSTEIIKAVPPGSPIGS